MSLEVSSRSFKPNQEIPTQLTCDGADRSPALAWSGVPPGTRSLALVVEDPDAPDPAAPQRIWTHWIVYNLPPDLRELPEGIEQLPERALEGLNDWGRTGYGGPCPPKGRHRYFHRLYALDAVLPDLGEPTRAQLQDAMQGHVLAEAELVGTYQKRHR